MPVYEEIYSYIVCTQGKGTHTHMNFRYVFLDFCLSFCMSFYVFYDRISKNTWDSCAKPNAQPSLSRVLWLVCTIPTCLYNY